MLSMGLQIVIELQIKRIEVGDLTSPELKPVVPRTDSYLVCIPLKMFGRI